MRPPLRSNEWSQLNMMAFSLLRRVSNIGRIVLLLLCPYQSAHSETLSPECGALRVQGRFGPYDYRADRYIPESTYKSHTALLGIVEGAHFTPEVEALIRGKTSSYPGPDMSYTLHAFPNHHRALIAMSTLGERSKNPKPLGSAYTVECWFQRALNFAPNDHIARLIFANYLSRNTRKNEAEQQLAFVASLEDNSAFTLNNIGLIYFELDLYDKAEIFAQKAYALGLKSPTLKEQLKRVGKWSEPEIVTPAKPASAPQ